MKRVMWVTGVVVVAMLALTSLAKDPEKLSCYVYGPDGNGNHWAPSGYMGNTEALAVDHKCDVNPHTGKVCMKVEYKAADNWAGVLWQDPDNDWKGEQPGGYNVTGAKKFAFWARGEKGGEKVAFGFGGDKGDAKFANTAKGEVKVELTTEWKEYTIDLEGKDLSLIKNGFSFSLAGNGGNQKFYLSEIRFE